MSNWDDLFCAAGAIGIGDGGGDDYDNGNGNGNNNNDNDIIEINNPTTDTTNSNPEQQQQQQSKKKAKKRKRKSNARSYQFPVTPEQQQRRQKVFDTFLNTRREIVIWSKLPVWLSIGASLCYPTTGCSRWERNDDNMKKKKKNDDDDDDDDCTTLDAKCKNCKLSILHHSLSVVSSAIKTTATTDVEAEAEADNDFSDEADDIAAAAAAAAAVTTILTAFTLVRDIRCCCSSILNATYGCNNKNSNDNNDNDKNNNENEEEQELNYNDYSITALKKSKLVMGIDIRSILSSSGEADILTQKFHKIRQNAISLNEKTSYWTVSTNNKNNNNDDNMKGRHLRFLRGILDDVVQLMISCDDAYYRIYYLQNAEYLPVLLYSGTNQNDNNTNIICIPHPPTYFGSNNITWDVRTDHVTDLMNTMKKKSSCPAITDKRWNELMIYFGINDQLMRELKETDLDPLCFLRMNRLSESIFIFHKSSWIRSKQAKTQMIQSTTNHDYLKQPTSNREDLFYVKHETPAPIIVKEWRDSCRDLLCNLYAYATISRRIIQDIKGILRNNDNSNNSDAFMNIIESGAGTGYIAHLLSQAGLNVAAYDVAPTKRKQRYGQYDKRVNDNNSTNTNEYHGSSPPFYHVKYADSKDIGSIFGKQREVKETALLLCYPPPLSNMAEDSLKAFVKVGGTTLIHIGEFSGLTGSSKFEHFLKRNFDLKYQTPCLHWGSDTSEVTIWSKKLDRTKKSEVVLVPCSQCKSIKSKLRCRLCRPLSYCSSSCFDKHKSERRVHFAFNMIPDVINQKELSQRGFDESNPFFQPI